MKTVTFPCGSKGEVMGTMKAAEKFRGNATRKEAMQLKTKPSPSIGDLYHDLVIPFILSLSGTTTVNINHVYA